VSAGTIPQQWGLAPSLSTDSLSPREREQARWHPERETLALAAAGAATVLGARHSATRALAKAAGTMDRVDLWRARLALRTLRLDQRQAIAEAADEVREGAED
jgi:hypothetical protein